MKITYRSEEELLLGIRNNDEAALRYLYKSYFPMIQHFIYNNNGEDQDAKDIYQESIIILIENLQKEEFQLKCKVKTYLYSVCRRLWLKKLAERNRFSGRIDDYESFLMIADDQNEEDDNERQIKVLQESLLRLGDPCKTIIEDYFIHSYTMQQICDKMGYTNTDNAKNQKYKCLMRLKKLFFSTLSINIT